MDEMMRARALILRSLSGQFFLRCRALLSRLALFIGTESSESELSSDTIDIFFIVATALTSFCWNCFCVMFPEVFPFPVR